MELVTCRYLIPDWLTFKVRTWDWLTSDVKIVAYRPRDQRACAVNSKV